jgi:hypothetical protein
MPAAWPTLAEVTAKLTARGVTVEPAEVTSAIAAAVSQWERETNIYPFLAETQDSTVLLDPPAWRTGDPRRLDLRSCYVSFTTVTVEDTVLTEGDSGYYTVPDAAPYTALEFNDVVDGLPRSIEIVGKRGYSATVPDDAWLAVMDLAVERLISRANSTGNVEKIKQGGVEIQYGKTSYDSARAELSQTASRYRRITF